MTLDLIKATRPASDSSMPNTQQLDSLLAKHETIRAELRAELSEARKEAGKVRTQHQLGKITEAATRGAIQEVQKLEAANAENERIIADLLRQRADSYFIESGEQRAEMKRQYAF